ncbi:hypothetical protein [Aequorivita marina]|uniref:hypothetical protein n=1 Tax=Aequorivita marina TaxID=3073654 RepID=UPI0028765EA6|nr:hypothetical protein [Aequorivita sp. S2608]MDS1298563.1 hypothetical protein [Aequorivita sp. S2608]
MIRFLIISLLFGALLSSCSLKTTEGLRQVGFNRVEVNNPYFSNPTIDYVYKAKIQLYRKNFGGILILKKLGPKNHRIVFTTEFGSKLFDFQFEGDSFTKHFVVKDLDKKFIINTLRKDFKLLITERAKVSAVYLKDNQRLYKTQSDGSFNFYFLDDEAEVLQKIVNTSKTKEKVEIGFNTYEKKDIADRICIKHHNIKLTIELEKFKK